MFPKKKYQIIYADPPWLFRVRSEKGNKRSMVNGTNARTSKKCWNKYYK